MSSRRTTRLRSRSRSRSPRRREHSHRREHERHSSSKDDRWRKQDQMKDDRNSSSRHRDRVRKRDEAKEESNWSSRDRDRWRKRDKGEDGSNSSSRDRDHHTKRDNERTKRDERKDGSNSSSRGRERWGEKDEEKGDSKEEKKNPTAHLEARDFTHSGKLLEDTNTFKGVVVKYSEPEEARIPKRRWRLYPFKGDQQLDVLYIHRQSAYLIGRERRVCDIPMHHPSISKQHAAFQYRMVPYEHDDGTMHHRVRPYVIDLGSTNGTYINNQRIEPSRYYELKEQDMIKFGYSSREYVLLHESSKDETRADDSA